MGDDKDTTPIKTRTDAATIIAELWAEREQALRARSPAAQAAAEGEARAAAEPEPPRSGGRERALATVIVLLLVGAGLGIGAQAGGLIGAPSKASFIAEADAACTPGNAGMNAITKPVGYQSLATSASTFVTTVDAQLRALRALDLPGYADRSRARNVLNAFGATGNAGRSLQAAAAAGDPAMTGVASRSMTLSAQDAMARAQAFGLTSCVAGMKPGIDSLIAGANGAVKTSFAEKASGICVELGRAIGALPRVRTADDLTKVVNQTVGLFEKMAADIKALPVPPGDEATVAAITSGIANVAAKMRELGNAALAGDVKRVNAIDKEGDALSDELDRRFLDYGVSACAA